jgi:hypothetical protein
MEVVDEAADDGRVVTSLQAMLDRSPYFYYVFRHVTRAGFRIGGRVFFLDMDFRSGRVRMSLAESSAAAEPEFWVEMDRRSLLEASATSPVRATVSRSTRGKDLPGALDEILARCLDGSRAGPAAADREALVFGPLFGFPAPETLWRSPDGAVRVLLYREGLEGLTACVTSGFTNPEVGKPAFPSKDHRLLGFGYELVVLCRGDVPVLWRELEGWARYVLETGNHVLRGNWLEYREGLIPNTDLGGFVVVAPATFPDSFPLAGGLGQWNLLLGVTPAELREAKQLGVVPVAQRLFESGCRDWSPPRRDSVLVH